MFVPEAGLFARITACVIDTSISKVLGCYTAAKKRSRGVVLGCNRTRASASKHAAARTCQMRLPPCRPSGPVYRPRTKEGGR